MQLLFSWYSMKTEKQIWERNYKYTVYWFFKCDIEVGPQKEQIKIVVFFFV